MYLVISMKHSRNGRVCFWWPNHAGYTENIDFAGRYSKEHVEKEMGYLDCDTIFTILESEFKEKFKRECYYSLNKPLAMDMLHNNGYNNI